MLISLNGGCRSHPFLRLIKCLELVKDEYGFDIKYFDCIPPASIWVDRKPIAYVYIGSGFTLNDKIMKQHIEPFDYRIIFKYHVDPLLKYGKYTNDRIIPCGLYAWLPDLVFDKKDLICRPRPIDVVALMKWSNRNTGGDSQVPWVVAKRTTIAQAKELGEKGYNIRAGTKIPPVEYWSLLLDTKIGFYTSAISGRSYLGWKIPEFTQHGVVMITEPLGRRLPLVNDAVFEDDANCVFCDDPNLFGQVAIELLNDKERLERLRRNAVELWEKKLAPRQVGKWLYKKIIEAC